MSWWGVDLTSVYPPEIKELPNVGYHRALSADGIMSMKPTFFLTDGNVGPEAVLDQIRKVGIPVKVMAPGGTPEDARKLLRELGALFGRKAAADSIVAEWQRGMDAALADTSQWSADTSPRVLVIHFGQMVNNYLGVKSGGAAGQVLHWAGAENAMDSVGGMSRLTPELIAQLKPDVIIATEVGFDRVGQSGGVRDAAGGEPDAGREERPDLPDRRRQDHVLRPAHAGRGPRARRRSPPRAAA